MPVCTLETKFWSLHACNICKCVSLPHMEFVREHSPLHIQTWWLSVFIHHLASKSNKTSIFRALQQCSLGFHSVLSLILNILISCRVRSEIWTTMWEYISAKATNNINSDKKGALFYISLSHEYLHSLFFFSGILSLDVIWTGKGYLKGSGSTPAAPSCDWRPMSQEPLLPSSPRPSAGHGCSLVFW